MLVANQSLKEVSYLVWISILFLLESSSLPLSLKDKCIGTGTTCLSFKNKAAEILLAIIHCNNCYSVFSLQLLPPWEMHGGNHIWTMTEVGRYLPQVTLSNHTVQSGPPRASCPVLCPNSFWISPGWRLSNLPGQPVPVPGHPSKRRASSDTKSWSCNNEALQLSGLWFRH